MIAEIQAGMGGTKALFEIAKGLQALKTETAINQAVIDIQRHALEAQQGLAAARDAEAASARRIAELEQEIMRLKDWSAEKQRYHLIDAWRGAVAYMPKPGMESGEPPHWLCANCFNQGRKSFLQFKGQDIAKSGGLGSESTYGCDACRASLKVSFRTKPTYPGSAPA